MDVSLEVEIIVNYVMSRRNAKLAFIYDARNPHIRGFLTKKDLDLISKGLITLDKSELTNRDQRDLLNLKHFIYNLLYESG